MSYLITYETQTLLKSSRNCWKHTYSVKPFDFRQPLLRLERVAQLPSSSSSILTTNHIRRNFIVYEVYNSSNGKNNKNDVLPFFTAKTLSKSLNLTFIKITVLMTGKEAHVSFDGNNSDKKRQSLILTKQKSDLQQRLTTNWQKWPYTVFLNLVMERWAPFDWGAPVHTLIENRIIKPETNENWKINSDSEDEIGKNCCKTCQDDTLEHSLKFYNFDQPVTAGEISNITD